jgi:hypothetical protein
VLKRWAWLYAAGCRSTTNILINLPHIVLAGLALVIGLPGKR